MAKRKFSILISAVCFLLVLIMVCGCSVIYSGSNDSNTSSDSNGNGNSNDATSYKLTVQDSNGYIIEDLQDQYKAGEEVTVKTVMLEDVDLGAYLDGVFLGFGAKVSRKIDSQWQFIWEFYFTMPAHNAVLSFGIPDGLTRKGIVLDEDIQQEIKTAVVNTYSSDTDPFTEDDVSLRCYGAFDGVYVLFIDVPCFCYTQAIKEKVIAGVNFVYCDGQSMYVYCDGAFYSISQAYDNGILSYDNLLTTQQNYKACNTLLYKAEEGHGKKNVATSYKLTVQDSNGYIIEDLQEQYKAGEEVTVKTVMLEDVDLGAYLDGVFLGFGAKVSTKIDSQWQFIWEFYFTMPAHNAVLSFGIPDGLTRNGIVLDEDTQQEIKTAFVNVHSNDPYPVYEEDISSLRCYGAFDGVYVLFVDVLTWGHFGSVTSDVIAGVEFIYSNTHTMVVYAHDAFYTISQAYDNGILSYDNLLTTQQNYKACRTGLYREEGNGNSNDATSYKLTVQDSNGYIIEDLQEQYQAGEKVTVKTVMLEDVDLGAYLDGVFLGFGVKVSRKIDSQWQFIWEFYFIMPDHDAVLSFGIPDGLTRKGIVLDEDIQQEIKTAFYNTYVNKYPDLPFEQLSLRCYGAFDGVYVIFQDGIWDCIDMVTSETIAGVTFVYPDGLHMTVYCDGAFYTLSEAYENGILSYDDLLTTQQTYKACCGSLYSEDRCYPRPID